MNKNAKIYLAGHRGLVGSAIYENLKSKGYTNIVTHTHKELDLANQADVAQFFSAEKPDYVFLAAAKVGGIVANNVYRADFIYENMMIQNNVIHQSYLNRVKKLLFLGKTSASKNSNHSYFAFLANKFLILLLPMFFLFSVKTELESVLIF